MPMITIRTTAVALAATMLFSACSKDEVEDTQGSLVNAPHANTALTMSMVYARNGTSFDPAVPFRDANNTLISIDVLKFFIAQPWFKDDGGATVASFPNKYLLVDLAQAGTIQTIGEVDAHLHTMHFGLGVDTTRNHDDPMTLTAPLNDPGMWWGWADGHKFLSLEGRYDSNNNDAIDANDWTFTYDCGMDTLYTPTVIGVHTDADQGGSVLIGLSLNIDTLMAGLNVADQPNVHMVNGITSGLMHRLSAGLSHVE